MLKFFGLLSGLMLLGCSAAADSSDQASAEIEIDCETVTMVSDFEGITLSPAQTRLYAALDEIDTLFYEAAEIDVPESYVDSPYDAETQLRIETYADGALAILKASLDEPDADRLMRNVARGRAFERQCS